MGGFLYLEKSSDVEATRPGRRHGASLAAMESKGLVRKASLERDRFVLHVFGKMRVDTDNVLELDNGDFVVATGTFIYKKGMGANALRALYRDFCNGSLSFENFLGHFAVWILKGDDLTVFNDYRGMYQLYHDEDRSVVCSAFLPVYETLTTRTANLQQVYEYFSFETTYGDKTVLQEIGLLDPGHIHQLLKRTSVKRKKISLPQFDGDRPFKEQVRDVHALLSDYFAVLAEHFGDRQSIGLTGGYDSRMTLAYLRQAGVRPVVYVHGPADSADVRIAQSIAKGEGFDIDYDPDEAKTAFEPGGFQARLQFAYRYLGGVPHSGIFDDWAMVCERRRARSRPELLRLYGMGGEIFRRTRHLADRPHTVVEYVKSQFDSFEHSSYSTLFDKRAFLSNIGNTLREMLDLKGEMMTRAETELGYPHFTLPRLSGPQMTTQNERAFALVPYAAPIFTCTSAEIPIDYKYLGRFQTELIRLADPRLVDYMTAYGFALGAGPNLKARIREQVKLYTPMSIRPFLYRQMGRIEKDRSRPFYLADDYLQTIFPDGCPNIESFIDIKGLTDYRLLSRALSLEVLLSGRLSG
jgi:hypothetical protein